MQIEVISTEDLGDRSYLVHDGHVAIVIDPQRDLDRIEGALAERGVTCGMVLETHIHNDYVTGGFQLAQRTGAPYVLHADDQVQFECRGVRDGDRLQVGSLSVEVLATPGHTDTHLSYVIDDGSGTPAVFTGGSLLYGSVGRTDLVDPARTEELTRAQYHSARRIADRLPDAAEVFPTHGFGSFCSSGSSAGGTASTIGVERGRNDALVEADEDQFVERLVAGLTAYPAYYAHMAPLNLAGPAPVELELPQTVEPDQLRKRIENDEWVVDLRDRTAYAARHLAGTIGISLGDQFSTYLGWLIPWGSPLTLIGDHPDDVLAAQRQLVRIGIDHLAGAAVGPIGTLGEESALQSYPVVTFADAAFTGSNSSLRTEDGSGDLVLDVRRDDERAHGAIPGSYHVPLHALLLRLDELPTGRLWIHCGSGYRASIAASLLARAGRDVVLINDDYSAAVDLGLATG